LIEVIPSSLSILLPRKSTMRTHCRRPFFYPAEMFSRATSKTARTSL